MEQIKYIIHNIIHTMIYNGMQIFDNVYDDYAINMQSNKI
jgi:hypothetical protein